MPHTTPLPTAHEVLTFWFGEAGLTREPTDDRSALWFGGGADLDQRIRDRFGALVAAAQRGDLQAWEGPLHSRLALVIVLDQFSRNVYRGQAQAFAADDHAQRLAQQTLAQDNELTLAGRVFLYMPLMHAEDLDLQLECVARFCQLVQHSPPEMAQRLQGNLRAARQHLDIVERFGRFPHRNAALGRTSTTDEAAFLTNGPRFGQ